MFLYTSRVPRPKSVALIDYNRKLKQLANITFFFFFMIVTQFIKSADGRNPYTREIYKRALKWDKKRINFRSLQK
jgi:hypothetical protein